MPTYLIFMEIYPGIKKKQFDGKTVLTKDIWDRRVVFYCCKFGICSGGAMEKELKVWVEPSLP